MLRLGSVPTKDVDLGLLHTVKPHVLPFRTLIPLAVCLFSFTFALPADGKEATLNMEVPGGLWKSIRLKNLPKGAVVGVNMQTSGHVTVSLVGHTDHQRAPNFTEPLFSSRVEKKISFSVTMPASGHYYVVFDNSLATQARSIKLTVTAVRGDIGERHKSAEAVLSKFQSQLNQIFIFDRFPITVRSCGVATAFVRDSGIVLCGEYAKKLYQTLGDKERASDALVFTLFHEVGHILLEQWQYPFYDNEEVADEFATATMVMLKQKKRVLAKAEFFAANPSMSEVLAKTFKDDRHPLSVQRARNIRRWAKDPNLVQKWQPVFVPHMQTAILEKLEEKRPAWSDPALVKKELAARR